MLNYSISKGLEHGCYPHLSCKGPPSKYFRLYGSHAVSVHVLLLLFYFVFYNSLKNVKTILWSNGQDLLTHGKISYYILEKFEDRCDK